MAENKSGNFNWSTTAFFLGIGVTLSTLSLFYIGSTFRQVWHNAKACEMQEVSQAEIASVPLSTEKLEIFLNQVVSEHTGISLTREVTDRSSEFVIIRSTDSEEIRISISPLLKQRYSGDTRASRPFFCKKDRIVALDITLETKINGSYDAQFSQLSDETLELYIDTLALFADKETFFPGLQDEKERAAIISILADFRKSWQSNDEAQEAPDFNLSLKSLSQSDSALDTLQIIDPVYDSTYTEILLTTPEYRAIQAQLEENPEKYQDFSR